MILERTRRGNVRTTARSASSLDSKRQIDHATRAGLLTLAGLVAACTPGAGAAGTVTTPTLGGSEMCRRGRMNSSPLVVEWPASERAQFESLAQRGLIVARYTGCELQVLTQCKGPGAYRYASITPKNEVEEIRGADELYAKLPLGAAALSATLKRSGQIVVDSTIVGRHAAEKLDVRESDLIGRCLGATHVVSGLTVGAFELSSGSSSSMSGDASVMNFGSRGSTESTRSLLGRDGDIQSCVAAPTPKANSTVTRPTVNPSDPGETPQPEVDPSAVDPSAAELAPLTTEPTAQAPSLLAPPAGPPAGCGALIRIDLSPLPEAEARLIEADKRASELLAEQRDAAASRRTLGYVVGGTGLALGALAGTFALLGSNQNATIQEGGFATKDAIKDAEGTGTTYNTLGYAFGIAGGALLGVGVPLILSSSPPEHLDDAFMTPKRRYARRP